MNRKFDLNLLVVFDTLMAERQVTRAAKRLGLTQSAVSSALGRLRVVLNDPLFVRGPSGLVPTARSLSLEKPVRDALEQVNEAIAMTVRFDPRKTNETIRIKAADHLMFGILPYLVPVIEKEAPGLTLELVPLVGDIYGELLLDESDILISYLFARPPDHLRVSKLFEEHPLVIARKDHPTVGSKLTAREYREAFHVVMRPRDAWLVSPLEQTGRALGLERKVRVYASHHMVIPQIVCSSDFLSVIPEELAKKFSSQFPIVCHPMPFKAPNSQIAMFWHERAHRNPTHQWLRSKIIAGARVTYPTPPDRRPRRRRG